MKNHRVIVVNGFRRGGTSLLWNLVQSHPSVCGPGRETGEILFDDVFRRAPALARSILTSSRMRPTPLVHLMGHVVDRALYARKMTNYGRSERYEGVPYSLHDVQAAALCLKSVDEDIALTEFFNRVYTDAAFVALMRNGYALCNGWMRRGMSAWQAGRLYRRIGQGMIERERCLSRYRIVKFEDVLRDPFGVAESIFAFIGVEPVRLPKLRLKVKKVLRDQTAHEVPFGAEGQKYWTDATHIADVLDQHIDSRQAALLTRQDRLAFAKHAAPVLDHFGYSDTLVATPVEMHG